MNRTIIRRRLIGVLTLLISGLWMAAAQAQQPAFNIIKPSTTGVPCNEVRVMGFDPAGNLWIGGRVIQWGEVALAMLSADQVGYHPLPGGGFDTGAWRVWSSVHDNPIPSVYLSALAFSSDGTVWVGSDAGLTRFRPNAENPADRWFTYTAANSPLVLNEIRSIAMDSQGNLWISNASLNFAFSYLFKLNTATGQWTQINSGEQPMEVAVGNNDHVFISMKNIGGIMEFNGTSWVHHDALPRELTSLMQDSQGNVWAAGSGINGEGLWKWNGLAWQDWPEVGGDVTVTGIGKDRDGVVYVSMWYGAIYKMINDTPVFFADADPLPRSVIGRPNGDIYVNNYGSNLGLGRVRLYNASGQLLSRMNIFNAGLPDYFIDKIRRDSSGNMWFASGEGGLSRMLGSNGAPDAATHWRNWGNYNDGSEPYPWVGNSPMYSVFEDENGIFWMSGNGVGRWNSVTGEFTDFWNSQNSGLDASGMHVIAKREGTMWVGSGGSGVSWLNGNNWTRVYLSGGPYNFSAENVNAMAVDTANNLWVGSEYGLRKFAPGDNTNFTLYLAGTSPLPSDYMLDVKADPSGGIWIGTAAGGLTRFDGTTWTTYNQGNTGMPGTNVADIARRPSDGLIAIANNQPSVWPYTGGVSTFDGATWRHYTPDNSPLTHWQVVSVEFDGNGNLWASTMSTGVVQIMIGGPNPSPSASPSASPSPSPSPSPSASPSPSPSASPSPSPSASPSPSPSPSPASKAINLSTRMRVQTGDNAGIGGFIITGSTPKHVLLRAIGPSLTSSGVPDALADPVLELHGPGGFATITNDNWRQTQEIEIQATGIAPTNDFESAIDAILAPGAYTAIVRGDGNTSGVALVEVYDLNQGAASKLANLSTRALVSTGDNIVIAGFMLGGSGDDRIVVRGIGPSLVAVGVPNALSDPRLELRDTNGALLVSNNDWQDDLAQASEISAAGLAPTNNLESALAATLPPGPYTALLSGVNNGTGIGLIEVYDRGTTP